MIKEALEFLVRQLNEYLHMKTTYSSIVQLTRLTNAAGAEIDLANKVVCQLVNIDEERIGKSQLPLAPPQGSNYPVRNPEIKLNLSVLFTASYHHGDDEGYASSLTLLSYVIQYFQYRHVFTTENSPTLPAAIGTLIVELYPVSLENQNYLWASLGVKYRPSVVYKVRLITVLEDSISDMISQPRIIEANVNNQPN
jgi:hypothetical protein